MSGKLDGRTALITGASKGLGKAMAIALAAEGARVGLVSRDVALLNSVAAEIGPRAEVFPADVTSEEQIRALEELIPEGMIFCGPPGDRSARLAWKRPRQADVGSGNHRRRRVARVTAGSESRSALVCSQ